MADEGFTIANRPLFSFQWGALKVKVSGDSTIVRDAFTLLREDILPKLHSDDLKAAVQSAESTLGAAEKNSEAGGVQSRASDTVPSIADFVASKKPQSEHEKAAVLAYYAKVYRNIAEFSVDDLESLYNEAHIPIKNVKNSIHNAGKKDRGWIKPVKGKRKVYYLTAAGENYVKTQMPKS